jgi:hypothetical protein
MRKISVAKDQRGQPVMMLNNQPLFQFGVLDQGYWPDGVYTAPADEALRSDIEAIKALGFNMCRKHLKVEPERWYYWCDRLGLLVWQDMPSGDRVAPFGQYEIERRPKSAEQFELEMERLIEGRRNHPSIVVWVPFHAGRGRYDTARIVAKVKELDPSRLVLNTGSAAVGPLGDVQSFTSDYKEAGAQGSDPRARILGECGSFPMPIAGHTWATNVFSKPGQRYVIPPQFAKEYTNTVRFVRLLAQKRGFSGAVFSQLTDVEDEVNGFLTYDRLLKVDPGTIAGANSLLWKPFGENTGREADRKR